MKRAGRVGLVAVWLALGCSDGGTGAAPTTGGCPALPMKAPFVTVTPAMDLVAVAGGAAPGSTLLLEDGTYLLHGAIVQLRAAGLTLRGRSGDAAKVIIDGAYT